MESKGIQYFPVVLPSRGLFYKDKDGNGILNDGRVYARKLRVAEEEMLQTSIDPVTKMSAIMSAICLITDAPDPNAKRLMPCEDLLLSDRMAVLLTQRLHSHGQNYKFTFKCDNCGQQNNPVINIAAEMDDYTPDKIAAKAAEKGRADFVNEEPFPVVLQDAGTTIYMRFLRGKDEAALYRRIKRYGLQSVDKVDHSPSVRLSLQIERVEGMTFPEGVGLKEIALENWIKQLTSTDSATIRRELELREPGIDTRLYPDCKSCGTPNTVRVVMDSEFFLPRDD